MAAAAPNAQQKAALAAMVNGMPPLAADWLTVLNRLGFTDNAKQTLARAHGITSLEDSSVYTREVVIQVSSNFGPP